MTNLFIVNQNPFFFIILNDRREGSSELRDEKQILRSLRSLRMTVEGGVLNWNDGESR